MKARKRVQGEKVLKARAQQVYSLLFVRRAQGRGPITAVDVADALGLAGAREHLRRCVREIVTHLRDDAVCVCANVTDGYWMARDAVEWHAYENAVRAKAVFTFVALRDRREKHADAATGQKRLF